MLVRPLPRTLAIMLTVVVIAGLGTLARPVPAHATGQCWTSWTVYDRAGHAAQIPSNGAIIDCWLARGSYNSAVQTLQVDLNQCYNANLELDGDFGPLTEQALRSAQAAAGTTPDGVYGPHTRDAIKWGFSGPYGVSCHAF